MMPQYEAPLDAPTPAAPPPVSSLPAVFWQQVVALLLWRGLAFFSGLDDYRACVVGMAVLLLVELWGTRPSKKPTIPTFRLMAWIGASAIVLLFVLSLFGPVFLEEVLHIISILTVAAYFFIWSVLLQDGEDQGPFPRLSLGMLLFFFYLLFFINHLIVDYIPWELLFVVVPAIVWCCYSFYNYWRSEGKERKQLIQQLGLLRSPQLFHLIISTFIGLY